MDHARHPWRGRPSPRVRLALALSVVLAGCGTPTATFEELRGCPAGDAAWREARDRAREEGRLAELLGIALEVSGGHPRRWEPRWLAGECLFYGRRGVEARPHFEATLRLARDAGDLVGVAAGANRLGWLTYADGDLHGGEALYREALAAAREARRVDLEAFVLNNLAGLLLQAGDFPATHRVLTEAIQSLRAQGLDSAARVAELNLGVVLLELGDAAAARDTLEAVHGASLDAGDRERAATAAGYLGKLAVLQDDLDGAVAWFERVPDDLTEQRARAELHLGRGLLARGEHEEAAARLAAAAHLTANRITALFAEVHRADAVWRLRRHDEARRLLERARDEARAVGAREIEWMALWLLGRADIEAERPASALGPLRAAVSIVDDLSEGLDPGDQGLRLLRGRAEPFSDLAFALVQAHGLAGPGGAVEELFAVVESAHARSLRRIITGTADASPSRSDLATVQAGLGPGELLLDYLIGDERGVLLALTADGARAVPIEGWRTLREPLRTYRAALVRPPADGGQASLEELAREGSRLRDVLLAPVADLVREARRVYVVPDRDLALLPPAGLPWVNGDGRPDFLGAHVETGVLPMAGPAPGWTGPRAPLLLAGDPLPDAEGEFPVLAYAARELDRIGRLWPASEVVSLEGEAFSPARFLDTPLGETRTIHLATHALASTLDPRRCAVVFSGGDRLGFNQLAELDLGPALVVLSACRTGEGEIVPGEGVLGLGWAFLHAGARGVAASLWNVEDASTARMMERFHRELRDGADPVTALTRARRAIREERPHPAYWAPFVLVLRPGE